MYKKNQNRQITLRDFNQPLGLKLNPENKWIKKAAMIPWDAIEDEYADLFPSDCGMPAKPLRMALGSLLIQKKYDYADRERVEQIQMNPYYQYFIGLLGFQLEKPFAPSLLVEFRKRLTEENLLRSMNSSSNTTRMTMITLHPTTAIPMMALWMMIHLITKEH